MIKTITLNYAYGSLSSREPIYCDLEEELYLDFEGPYKLDNAIVVLENNKMTKRCRLENSLRVDKSLLLAGTLHVTVCLMAQGKAVKQLAVEPICIQDSGSQLLFVPEIEPLKAKMAELEQRAEALEKSLQSFQEAVTAQLQATVAAHNKLVEQVKILQDEQAL